MLYHSGSYHSSYIISVLNDSIIITLIINVENLNHRLCFNMYITMYTLLCISIKCLPCTQNNYVIIKQINFHLENLMLRSFSLFYIPS